MRSVLKDTLIHEKFDPNLYNLQSLRLGRGMNLLKLGISVENYKEDWPMEIECGFQIYDVNKCQCNDNFLFALQHPDQLFTSSMPKIFGDIHIYNCS